MELMIEQANRFAKGSIFPLHLIRQQVSFEGKMVGLLKEKR